MEQSFFQNKQKEIIIILLALSVIIYLFTGLNGIFISIAIIIASAAIALATAAFTSILRSITVVASLVILTAAGIYIHSSIVDALIFTASVAAVGISLGLGIRFKKPFSEYMTTAIVLLFIISAFSIIYDLMLTGTPITMDNAINYFTAPSIEMINSYSSIAASYGFVIDTDILATTMKNMAIGTFCAAITLQVFFSYVLAGLFNIKLKISQESFFEILKRFKISKIGAILFIVAAIANIWSTEGTVKLLSLNLYTMMQFPMTLCGILSVFRLMTLYKAKIKTKRIATAVLVVLSLIPILNISSGLAFIGALDSIVSMSTPKDGNKELK